jgi:hypothetical protein
MASFVQTGDPNSHKVTNTSFPEVPTVVLNKQFVVQAGGVKVGDTEALQRRCAFWKAEGKNLPA